MPTKRPTSSALSAAERKRRSRAHLRGDHSLCDPERGCQQPDPVVSGPPDDAPTNSGRLTEIFGQRGQQLWNDMAGAQMGPAHRTLLVEACRLADRCERFDRLIAGGEWLSEREDPERPYRVEIVVDRLLSEARQHTTALKAIVAQLEERPRAAPAVPPTKGGGGIADLTALIKARRGESTAG